MLSAEQNDELTLTGPGTAAGTLMRQFWMPAALTDELDQGRPVVPVSLLGEKLALFRSDSGELALVGRHCAHRGVDLCYGRIEDGGIRCPFHGWHYDLTGQCTEQPGEPLGSTLHENVSIASYPVVENNGIVWAFMGDGDPPEFPEFDCFAAPSSHVFAFKGLWRCNWLQALEVGIDPVHASFLHRFAEDEDTAGSYGKQFRDASGNTDMPQTRILREFHRPKIEVSETDWGLRLVALRDLENGQMHVRVTNQIFPCAIHIPMSQSMTITQWHVPVDDHTTYWYAMFTSFGEPVDREKMREQRLRVHTLPDYVPTTGQHNRYGHDPEEQRTTTYTGMGSDINVHDQWACESMGAIQDRSTENLATTDIGIATYRKLLRRALRKARRGDSLNDVPLINNGATLTGPAAVDAITDLKSWESDWLEYDRTRRQAAPWCERPKTSGS